MIKSNAAGNRADRRRGISQRPWALPLTLGMLWGLTPAYGQEPYYSTSEPSAPRPLVSIAGDSPADTSSPTPPARELLSPLPEATPQPDASGQAIAIDWPTVLQLSRASNVDVEIAQEKSREAKLQLGLAKQQWIPSLRVGTSYLHHEGRIQDIPGQIIDTSKGSLFGGLVGQVKLDPQKVAIDVLKAKQNVTIKSGELDRSTREAMQQASLAYLDLVSAQAGAAISVEIADLIGELVDRSAELLKQGVGTQVDVLNNKTHYRAQLQTLNSARQNQLSASAQLTALLSLDPCVRLFAADEHLVPIRLVDENQPECELVAQAMRCGPGIQEVCSLIRTLRDQEKNIRKISLMPSLELDFGQGTFGGGFGSDFQDFDSRTDIGVHVYWDLMRVFGTAQTRELFESQRRQATLTQRQIMGKVSSGVIVARNSAIKSLERVRLAEMEIDTAIRSYKLSQARLKAAETLSFEVLQAIGLLGKARANYLQAVMDYNRAQILLQYLIGSCDCTSPTSSYILQTPSHEMSPHSTDDGAMSPLTETGSREIMPGRQMMTVPGAPSPPDVQLRPLNYEQDLLGSDSMEGTWPQYDKRQYRKQLKRASKGKRVEHSTSTPSSYGEGNPVSGENFSVPQTQIGSKPAGLPLDIRR